jgi:N-methylhydantoinase A
VPLGTDDLDRLVKRFHDQYSRIYGFADPEAAIEMTNIRVTAVGVTPKPVQAKPPGGTVAARRAEPVTRRQVFEDLHPVEAHFYDRATFAPGMWFDGPAVVEAADTTVYVPHGFVVHVDAWGNLIGNLAGCAR